MSRPRVTAEERVVEPDAGSGFDPFYRSQYASMVRLAYLMTGSAATAEELVQESFLRVHQRWATVAHPTAYTRRAVVNACRSHNRRRRVEERHRRRVDEQVIDLDADELSDALAALSYRQRAAIVLRFYLDLGEKEIAEALGCRLGTVGPLITRGLAQLRGALADETSTGRTQ
ncbi:MAG: RNA polymerase sigma-E factor [Acidimicrobiales bacterium]|nr:MAG: sigma-70 family RNA polymerase sigma factor [Actinomycetota bacterium]MBV6507438.1 RNA polymerase sigma-E factor [Acidimicrobiales bacterium]RIK07818.1 MAG: hypothetical protein DCC48_02365 [Acidobacteriota bacterium]